MARLSILLAVSLLPVSLFAQTRSADTVVGIVRTLTAKAPKPLGIWPMAQQDSMARLLCAQIPAMKEGAAAVVVVGSMPRQRMMIPWYTAIRRNELGRSGPTYWLWAENQSRTLSRSLTKPGIALRTRRLANRGGYRSQKPPGSGHHLLYVLYNGKITHVVPLSKDHLPTLLPAMLYAAQDIRHQAILEMYRTQRLMN